MRPDTATGRRLRLSQEAIFGNLPLPQGVFTDEAESHPFHATAIALAPGLHTSAPTSSPGASGLGALLFLHSVFLHSGSLGIASSDLVQRERSYIPPEVGR